MQLNRYNEINQLEPDLAPGFSEHFETIGELEQLSSVLLKHSENGSDPNLNMHRLMGTMMKNIVKLTCKWVCYTVQL